MIQLRVIVFFHVTLFFVVCVCAAAALDATNKPNKTKAEESVNPLYNLTATVLRNTEMKYMRAESTKTNVEAQKKKAERAESYAKEAATAITAVQRKAEVAAIAKKAKTELDNCLTLYKDAKSKAAAASNHINVLLTTARNLSNKAKINISALSAENDNYAQVIASAATVKRETEKFSPSIEKELTLLTTAETALLTLTKSAEKVQVLKYQAESIVIVSTMESLLKTAESDIQSIEHKRDAINTNIHEMEKNSQTAPDTSIATLTLLLNKAKVQLPAASENITDANTWKTNMLENKTKVDRTLATLKDTTTESKAATLAKTVKLQVKPIVDEFYKIKEALKAANTFLSSAEEQHKQMLAVIPPKYRTSGSEPRAKNQNGDVLTEGVKKTNQSGEAITAAKQTMHKTSDQSVNTNLDNTEQNKLKQLMNEEKKNSKDDKLQLINNDTLRNITKNVTKNPLIGGEVPKWSAKNDSAMTVSVPLLVTLIVSAVLH